MLDCHIHLQHVEPLVRTQILREANRLKMSCFFCNATGCNDWQNVLDIAAESGKVRPFLGVHPWFVDELPRDWEAQLASLLETHPCGIGEIGLDKTPKGKDFALQTAVFLRQLELAVRLQRPVVLHCVQAWGPLMEIVRTEAFREVKMIFHSFNGSAEIAHELMAAGRILSFSPRSLGQPAIRDILKKAPPAQFLLETDFPYLPGVALASAGLNDYRSGIIGVYQMAAKLRGIDPARLGSMLEETGKRFLVHG